MEKAPGKTYLTALQTAKSLFATRGYETVTTAEICEAAGISNGSLFHHFRNKEGIAVAVFKSLVRTYQADIAAALDKTNTAEAGLKAFITAHTAWIERDPDGARILFNAQHPKWSKAALADIRTENQAFGKHFAEWRHRIKDGSRIREQSLALVLAVLVGPTQMLSRAWLAGQSSTPPSAQAEKLGQLAVKALLD
ncbi:MAG: TetR/AcrR family transcriptional regulator [Alphaproteobacteria bacterium]|nr:TetR/AcrR family transcriptional regulator [Alphaproteobacteria bacterium]MBO6627141.1 TetR/AcrR family transcriptional regulator [Alphaproteobacteria bacterium]MDF1626368.1 TetR/AcrR family transcriptional regulator [Parvibaculaceae bacterium]